MLQPSAYNKHIHGKRKKQRFSIAFNLNCKNEYVIYAMESIVCKIQHVRKAETAYNLQ